MSLNETIARWDNFLDAIEKAFVDLKEKAQLGLPTLFDRTGMSPTPFTNAWQGISLQAQGLIRKIEETWDEKVSDSFTDFIDDDSAEFNSQWEKGMQLQHNLTLSLKKTEVKLFAQAAHELFAEAKGILSADFCCSQCQAKLEIKDNFFRSYYVTCEFCLTVNTFEPGSKVRTLEYFGIEAIAKEAALESELKYEDAKFKNELAESNEFSKTQLFELYKEFVEIYLKKRIELIPDYQERYVKDLEAKLSLERMYN